MQQWYRYDVAIGVQLVPRHVHNSQITNYNILSNWQLKAQVETSNSTFNLQMSLKLKREFVNHPIQTDFIK